MEGITKLMRISDFTILDSTGIIVDTPSDSFQIEHLIGFSAAITYTADSNFTGNFVLQVSNDDETWNDMATTSVSDTSGNCMFNVTDTFYKHARIKLDMSTGTLSTVTVKIYAKGW
jgi:hypothetical protein